MPMQIWRRLFMQAVRLAFSLARLKAGSNIAARMAIIAITTSNSIKVKPRGGSRPTRRSPLETRAPGTFAPNRRSLTLLNRHEHEEIGIFIAVGCHLEGVGPPEGQRHELAVIGVDEGHPLPRGKAGACAFEGAQIGRCLARRPPAAGNLREREVE